MKRVLRYYIGNLVLVFLLLGFVDTGSNGYLFLAHILTITFVFFFAMFGRDLILKYPIMVSVISLVFLFYFLLAFRGVQ